jgi:hypothetical protein
MDNVLGKVNAIVGRAYAELQDLGVELQGVMIDHDGLMQLKGLAIDTEHLVEDKKYRTKRLRLGRVGVTAGDSTRQAP